MIINNQGRTETFLHDGGWRWWRGRKGKSRSNFEAIREKAAHRPTDAINIYRRGVQLLKINVETPTEPNIKKKLHNLIQSISEISEKKFDLWNYSTIFTIRQC